MRRHVVWLLLIGLLSTGCPGSKSPTPEARSQAIRENNLGTSQFGRQDWSEAEAAFQRGLKALPEDATLLNNLSIALQQQGRTDEAEVALRQALAVDAGNPWVNYNLGLLEKNRGNFKAAINHFEIVSETDDQDVFLLYNLGAALSRTEDLDQAERILRRAVERNPTHVSSLYALGRLLLQSDRAEEGAGWIERSQELRAQSGLNEAVGTQYGEQGPYALGCDFPGGGLEAPPATTVTFTEGTRLPAVDCAALTRSDEDDSPPQVVTCEEGELVLAVADLDNDGKLERLSVRSDGGIYRRTGETTAHLLTLVDPSPVLAAVDVDHDGDLDLVGCEISRCRIAVNDSNASFRWDEAHDLPWIAASGAVVALGFSDLDNDRDIDLWVAGTNATYGFANNRDGSFAGFRLDGNGTAGVNDAVIADIDKDGWMDLLLASASGVSIHSNRRGEFQSAVGSAFATGPDGVARTLQIGDLDNDGLLDIVTEYDDATGWWRNLGLGSFQWQPLDGAGSPLEAADFDLDGDLDLLMSDTEGLVWRWNEGGNAHHWIRIDPQGVGDNRYAIGTKIELLAGDLRQKYERTGPLTMLVGLGDRTLVDSVRMLWPGGVLQDEVDYPADKPASITQLDRKGTSCPILYAWKDGRYQFVTDFLGGSAIGYLHEPGVYSTPDTDEIVKIETGLDAIDGKLRLRMNNQLEEVIWFDQTELIVVDHPVGTTVTPNERLMPGPPWPEFGLFASSELRPILAATELESGRDVTERLRDRDGRDAEVFKNLTFKGYAEPHTLELDLGDWPAGTRIVLMLDGWIDYADSSSNLAATQAGIQLSPPRLAVANGEGGWSEVEGRMGFPAGLPKTMTVEVGDLFRSGDHRLRIATNMRIHWDRARIMIGGEQTALTVRRLPVMTATLDFGGFPLASRTDSGKPLRYDPAIIATEGGWKTHAGSYTAYGEVTELLAARDDFLVTTKGGDAIELFFSDPGPPAEGQTRTFLLFADGFGKDMDPNSAANDRVGPIPFHDMPSYPYGPGVIPPEHSVSTAGRLVPPAPNGLHGVPDQVAIHSKDE